MVVVHTQLLTFYFLKMFWAPMKAECVSLKSRIISGGKRFKISKKKVEFQLSDEDMKYLKENTRYDEEEIREWFRWDLAFFLSKLIRGIQNISS